MGRDQDEILGDAHEDAEAHAGKARGHAETKERPDHECFP
jgi:hypothetical protein